MTTLLSSDLPASVIQYRIHTTHSEAVAEQPVQIISCEDERAVLYLLKKN